jgi:FtsZ-binding cell division protein ZapB
MLRFFSLAILFALWGSFAFAQSPYGRVLTLDNNGTQQWIDIGVVLSTYPTYHPSSPSPSWLTSGNSLSGSEKLGSTNNQPIVMVTNDTNRFRFTTKGQIEVLNSAGSVFLGEGAGANQDNSANRYNVFIGYQAGNSNTTGDTNTASGAGALYSNTTGYLNTASGAGTLFFNTTGYKNTANGAGALYSNTTGYDNTASGVAALYSNTTGYSNTASGAGALYNNTTGDHNTASGVGALSANTTGYNNTAIGYDAGSTLTTGSNNILIGYNAQPSSATVSNEVTIGNSSNNSYRIYAGAWTYLSDARYKHDIADLPYGLDFILKLRPRQFVYNNSTDHKITMGFIAQEVQQVMKQYDMQDKYNLVKIMEKDFLGLNTTEIIPVLVKAVQELSFENEKLKNNYTQLQKENAELKSRVEQFSDENEALKSRLERLEKIVLQGGVPENTNLGSTK